MREYGLPNRLFTRRAPFKLREQRLQRINMLIRRKNRRHNFLEGSLS